MEKLVNKIVSLDSNVRHEGTEWEEETTLGYRVYDNHPLAEMKEVGESSDLQLFLGSYEVKNYDRSEFECNIPILYCVRTFTDDYYRFVCGLDLMSDGRVWVGIGEDSYFNSIEEAMNFVQKYEGKECVIFTEEKMLI
jgi:hypothetical protein